MSSLSIPIKRGVPRDYMSLEATNIPQSSYTKYSYLQGFRINTRIVCTILIISYVAHRGPLFVLFPRIVYASNAATLFKYIVALVCWV